MELGLSLGSKGVEDDSNNNNKKGFCMGLGLMNNNISSSSSPPPSPVPERVAPPSSQVDLLPFSPLPRPPPPSLRFPWLPDNMSSEPGSSDGPESRTMDMNRDEQSSPNSGTSSFMEFSLYTSGNGVSRENNNNNNTNTRSNHGENGNILNNYGRDLIAVGVGTTTSRGSDDDENGLLMSSSNRKKLRLSKEQSAFLEESFKEHHTLNPKQKLALAKQLNLRPRQVEVWFQNRRARTKLKQTEVDCEYLKRCCETLTEENRRLQKELQELRALKTSQPFFMQRPATTLTMCPSCERVAPTSASTSAAAAAAPSTVMAAKPADGSSSVMLSLGKSRPVLPFSRASTHQTAS